MPKYLISYLLMETHPHDLHENFKNKAKSRKFSEYVHAKTPAGQMFFSKLPHTTLCCSAENIKIVKEALELISNEVFLHAKEKKLISDYYVDEIEKNGGLIETMSISHFIAPPGNTLLMEVKNGKLIGTVHDDMKITACLEYQKSNS